MDDVAESPQFVAPEAVLPLLGPGIVLGPEGSAGMLARVLARAPARHRLTLACWALHVVGGASEFLPPALLTGCAPHDPSYLG